MSLVLGLAHCERHGYSLPCIEYCFHGPDQKILTDAGRGKSCLIFKGEHGVQKFANLAASLENITNDLLKTA